MVPVCLFVCLFVLFEFVCSSVWLLVSAVGWWCVSLCVCVCVCVQYAYVYMVFVCASVCVCWLM